MDNNIDQQFKEYFQNRSMPPSQESWNRLDMLLDAEEPTQIIRKFPLYRIAAAIAFVLTFVSIGYHFYTEREEAIIAATSQEANTNLAESDVADIVGMNEEVPGNIPVTQTVSARHIIKYPSVPATDKRSNPASVLNNQAAVTEMDASVLSGKIEKNHLVLTDNQSVESKTVQAGLPVLTDLKIDPEVLLNGVESKLKSTSNSNIIQLSNTFRPDPLVLLAQADARLEANSSAPFIKRMYREIQDNSAKIYATLSNRNYEYK